MTVRINSLAERIRRWLPYWLPWLPLVLAWYELLAPQLAPVAGSCG